MEMSEKFTSSNGGTVKMLGNRRMIVTDTAGYKLSEDASVKSHTSWLGPAQIDTLREFFQHEIGVWIDPETGTKVVRLPQKDDYDGRAVTFLGGGYIYWETLLDEDGPARRYFDAHPEPKPWHEAMPGEVWVVRVTDDDMVMTVHESEYGGLRFRRNDRHGTIYALDTPSIREGRRIWPEVPDEA